MILKNAMEITFARVELTSSELEISFPIHLPVLMISEKGKPVNRFESVSNPFRTNSSILDLLFRHCTRFLIYSII